MGYRVITATSCLGAINAAGSHKVDLVLLDYNLPDGVGTDLLRTLRLETPDLPVVMCSGRASGCMAAEVGELGAACFVAKPVTATTLHEIFRNLLI